MVGLSLQPPQQLGMSVWKSSSPDSPYTLYNSQLVGCGWDLILDSLYRRTSESTAAAGPP